MKIQRYDDSLMPNPCGRWVDYFQVKQIKNESYRYGILVGACASMVGAVLNAILF